MRHWRVANKLKFGVVSNPSNTTSCTTLFARCRSKAAKTTDFTVSDVEKMVRADASTSDSVDPYSYGEDFEMVDDAPPPFSAVQVDEDVVDVAELLVQLVVGGLDPFPKKEGTEKVNLSFEL